MPGTVPVFWSRWIVFLSLFLILYGLAMMVAPQTMNSVLVGPLLYHDEAQRIAFAAMVEPDVTFFNIINGLLGTVTIGYAILIGWIAFEPFHNGERWAWNALAMSVTVWAVLEGYLKLSYGLGMWSQAHLGLLVAFGIPLLATYRDFHVPAKMD